MALQKDFTEFCGELGLPINIGHFHLVTRNRNLAETVHSIFHYWHFITSLSKHIVSGEMGEEKSGQHENKLAERIGPDKRLIFF